MRVVLTLLLLAGCKPADQGPSCSADSDCGELALCEEGGTCRSVQCLTTQDCAFGDWCTDDKTCEEGCGSDLDCVAGETCSDHVCEPYGCRDTQLDCPLGQYCIEGECELDDRGHCASCDPTNPNSCGNNATCAYYAGPSCNNNGDCDPGWSCDNLGTGKICHLDFCVVECNPNADLTCPRGLLCQQVFYGQAQTYCAGDCEFLIEEGAF